MCKLAYNWHLNNAEQIAREYGFDVALSAWKAIEALLPFCNF